MTVNQWVPAAHRGDAIGDSARRVRGLLRADGPPVGPVRADDRRRPQGRRAAVCRPEAIAGDLTIFHYALPSPMTEAFARLPHGRVLQYHNVTPAHFFAPYDAGVFRLPPRSAARSWRHWPDAPTWRWAIRPTTGRSSTRSASATPASSPSPSTSTGSPPRRAGRRSSGCSTTGRSTSCSSAESCPTRRSRITSGSPRSTNATSTSTTGSSSSAAPTACRATTT